MIVMLVKLTFSH